MATVRKSDGRIWLEVGEFPQLPSLLKNKLRYEPAGTMDNYIIGYAKDLMIYIPIVDAVQFLKSYSACNMRN